MTAFDKPNLIAVQTDDLMRFLHRTLADIHDALDPRSPTPNQDAIAARAKAKQALKVAADFGVWS